MTKKFAFRIPLGIPLGQLHEEAAALPTAPVEVNLSPQQILALIGAAQCALAAMNQVLKPGLNLDNGLRDALGPLQKALLPMVKHQSALSHYYFRPGYMDRRNIWNFPKPGGRRHTDTPA